MEISLNGFGENVATFSAADGVLAGMPVKLTANGTVGPCAAGDVFCGVACSVRGGFAGVQLRGYAALPYDGAAPAVGYQSLAAAAGGKVEVNAAGRTLLVTDVDEAAKTCGVLL